METDSDEWSVLKVDFAKLPSVQRYILVDAVERAMRPQLRDIEQDIANWVESNRKQVEKGHRAVDEPDGEVLTQLRNWRDAMAELLKSVREVKQRVDEADRRQDREKHRNSKNE